MLFYGLHPFPPDIEEMVRRVLALNPKFPDDGRRYVEQLEWVDRFLDWAKGIGLDEGRRALQSELEELRPADSD